MTSTLAWLDYSERERRRALDAVSRFQEKETVDELGLGTVRDGIADQLFPGTSTIQTRLRYFLIVPWTYQEIEMRRGASGSVSGQARKAELELLEKLGTTRERGVIGRLAGRAIQRLPSSIYWGGLGAWGIRLYPGSQPEYHRAVERAQRAGRPVRGREAASDVERPNWHLHIPPPPESFASRPTLSVSQGEAEFLRECLLIRHPRSLLAWLASQPRAWTATDHAWQLSILGRASAENRRLLEHARLFALLFLGASLLYHLQLAEQQGKGDRVDQLSIQLREWQRDLSRGASAIAAWDLADFWVAVEHAGARVPWLTKRFSEAWIARVRTRGGAQLQRDREARSLIAQRESQLKGIRARLGNPRRLELWKGFDQLAPLDFRWSVTQSLLLEMLEPQGD